MKLYQGLGIPYGLEPASNTGSLVSGENIGIEIELENMPIPLHENGVTFMADPPVGWIFHKDGSLRNKGVEFVFKKPAGGIEVENRLDTLNYFIDSNAYKPDASSRCSVHVHVDAGNVTTGELLKWLLVYTVYEPLLFAAFAPERENSNFCVPVHQSEDIRTTIMKLKGNKRDTASGSWTEFIATVKGQREQKRYGAVNLDAVRKFGTLEFRHLGGEWKKEPILDWVNTLLSMKKWAMNTETSVKDFFHGPSRVYADTLTYRIFGNKIAQKILRIKDFSELYLKGVRSAQEIYLMRDIPSLPRALRPVVEIKKRERLKRNTSLLKKQLKTLRFEKDSDDIFIRWEEGGNLKKKPTKGKSKFGVGSFNSAFAPSIDWYQTYPSTTVTFNSATGMFQHGPVTTQQQQQAVQSAENGLIQQLISEESPPPAPEWEDDDASNW